MRTPMIMVVMLLTGSHLFGAEAGEPENYLAEYKTRTFGAMALLRVTAAATYGEITNNPDEWGRTMGGFGKRVASGMGTHVIKNSIAYPMAAALHEDMNYHRSTSERFAPRLGHALLSTVMTRKTTTGNTTVAFGYLSGTFGSALISRTWQPSDHHSWGSGYSSAGFQLCGQAAVNVFREFWPRKNKN